MEDDFVLITKEDQWFTQTVKAIIGDLNQALEVVDMDRK